MWGAVLGSAINIAGDLIGNNMSFQQQQALNAQAHVRQIQLMRMQNRMNRDNAEWEYQMNSPAMKMQRLKEAGLNPNMVYGEGESAQTPLQMPGVSIGQPAGDFQSHFRMSNYGDMVTNALNLYLRDKQIASQVKVADAQYQNQMIKNMYDAQQLAHDYNVTPEGEVIDVNGKGAVGKGFDMMMQKQEQEMENARTDRELRSKEIQHNITQAQEQLKYHYAQLNEQKRQFDTADANQKKLIKAQIAKINADIKSSEDYLKQQEKQFEFNQYRFHVESMWEELLYKKYKKLISNEAFEEARKDLIEYIRDHKVTTHYENAIKGVQAVGGLIRDVGDAFKPKVTIQDRHYHTDNATIYTGNR